MNDLKPLFLPTSKSIMKRKVARLCNTFFQLIPEKMDARRLIRTELNVNHPGTQTSISIITLSLEYSRKLSTLSSN